MKYITTYAKCEKRQSCKAPCAFVEEILNHENHLFGRQGKDTIPVYPQWFEIQEGVLLKQYEDNGKPDEAEFLTTECDSPWLEFNPKLERTRVVIFYALKGFSFGDIVMMFDTDAERVRQLYKDSIQRLVSALRCWFSPGT